MTMTTKTKTKTTKTKTTPMTKTLKHLVLAGVAGLLFNVGATGCGTPDETEGFSQAELTAMVAAFHQDVIAVAADDREAFVRTYPNIDAIKRELQRSAAPSIDLPGGVAVKSSAITMAVCDRIWNLMQADFASGNISRGNFFLDSFIGNCL